MRKLWQVDWRVGLLRLFRPHRTLILYLYMFFLVWLCAYPALELDRAHFDRLTHFNHSLVILYVYCILLECFGLARQRIVRKAGVKHEEN